MSLGEYVTTCGMPKGFFKVKNDKDLPIIIKLLDLRNGAKKCEATGWDAPGLNDPSPSSSSLSSSLSSSQTNPNQPGRYGNSVSVIVTRSDKDLFKRLILIIGEIRAGNHNPNMVEEGHKIADFLLGKKKITRNEHEDIYHKLG